MSVILGMLASLCLPLVRAEARAEEKRVDRITGSQAVIEAEKKRQRRKARNRKRMQPCQS